MAQRFADRVADAGLPPVLLISPGWTYATGGDLGRYLPLFAGLGPLPDSPLPE